MSFETDALLSKRPAERRQTNLDSNSDSDSTHWESRLELALKKSRESSRINRAAYSNSESLEIARVLKGSLELSQSKRASKRAKVYLSSDSDSSSSDSDSLSSDSDSSPHGSQRRLVSSRKKWAVNHTQLDSMSNNDSDEKAKEQKKPASRQVQARNDVKVLDAAKKYYSAAEKTVDAARKALERAKEELDRACREKEEARQYLEQVEESVQVIQIDGDGDAIDNC